MYRVIYIVHYYFNKFQQNEDVLKTFEMFNSQRCILSIFLMIMICILANPQKSSPLVLFQNLKCINVFLMFLGLPSFFSFLEGLTNGLTIPEGCEILEATRATFLEALCSSVDTPGSGPTLVNLAEVGPENNPLIPGHREGRILSSHFQQRLLRATAVFAPWSIFMRIQSENQVRKGTMDPMPV